MAYNDNVIFKTSTTGTIDTLLNWNKTTGAITAKTDIVPIAPGTVYFTADGHIIYDLDQNNRLWMGKNAYSAIYAQDMTDAQDIASKLSTHTHTWDEIQNKPNTFIASAVMQNATNFNNTNYRILLSGSATNNAETTSLNKSSNLIYNPSTNKLSTGNVDVGGSINITGNANLNGETSIDSATVGNILINGSASFVQSPVAPTPTSGDNSTKIATTAFVTTAVGALTKSDIGLDNVTNHQQVHEVSWDSTNKKITKSKNGTASDVVSFSAGSGISLTAASNSLTIGHSNSITSGTAGSNTNTSGTTISIPYVSYDSNGHITTSGNRNHTISVSDLGLSSAMHFIGSSSTAVSQGGNQNPTINGNEYSNKQAGDVVLYNTQEFVYTANNTWQLLGDEGSYKIKQTAISDPTANGNSTSFIATISQNANGEITATKANLPITVTTSSISYDGVTFNKYVLSTATSDSLGGIKLGYSENNKKYAVKVDNNGKAFVEVPWTDNNTTNFTITANATDGLWDLTGTNGTNSVTYALAPYSSKQTNTSFYTGTTNPTLTTRLNYDGYLYATKLYSGGNEVLTSHQSVSNKNATLSWSGATTVATIGSTDIKISLPSQTQLSGGSAVTADATIIGGVTVSNHAITATKKTLTVKKVDNVAGITIAAGGTDNKTEIQIGHADTSSASNLTANGRTYVTGLTFDTYGHVTGYTTGTETVVNSNTHRPVQINGTEILGNNTTPLNLKAGSNVSLSNDSGEVTISATDTTYTFDGTYNASTNKAATVSTVTNAINGLDSSLPTGSAASKTITALTITNGKIASATFSNIAISGSQITAGTIANDRLTNSSITIGGQSVNLGGNLSLADIGLSTALRFKGVTTTTMSDNLTTAAVVINNTSYTPTTGDVVLYNDSEFVWTGEKWELLGRDSSFKLTQTAFQDSTGTAENTTATRFIYSISQDKDGVVSVKTRPLPTYNNYSLPVATTTTLGGIKVGSGLTINNEVLSINGINTSSGSTTKALSQKGTWIDVTNNTGTVTSVAASGSNGITISGSPITTSGTITVGLNLSTAINGLGEGSSPANRNDYIVAQYVGGGTTTTTYYRRKLSNIFKALNSSDITTALGYTPYNATNPNGYTTNTGTVTSITLIAGSGISLDTDNTAITTSGSRTISLQTAGDSSIGGIKLGYTQTDKKYAIKVNNSGQAYVEVPWENTTYSSKSAAQNGTDVSLVTTGEKYIWNNKQDALTAQTAYSAKGSSKKVAQITTNSLGQVTSISEVNIAFPTKSSWNYDDTYVKYSASQSLTNDQKAQARTNIGAGTSSLTIGTTASTAAAGNHTHTASLATDTGTSVITLAYGAKYKLTAGGQSIIFTMPSSDNTNTTYTFANGTGGTFKVTPSGGSAQTVKVGTINSENVVKTFNANTTGTSIGSVSNGILILKTYTTQSVVSSIT